MIEVRKKQCKLEKKMYIHLEKLSENVGIFFDCKVNFNGITE